MCRLQLQIFVCFIFLRADQIMICVFSCSWFFNNLLVVSSINKF
uniref:Uncharacterized protein n=1 Tax=Rhizophora mucronata TaxID=61149 RepID=A0A2P2IW59_RHIMU